MDSGALHPKSAAATTFLQPALCAIHTDPLSDVKSVESRSPASLLSSMCGFFKCFWADLWGPHEQRSSCTVTLNQPRSSAVLQLKKRTKRLLFFNFGDTPLSSIPGHVATDQLIPNHYFHHSTSSNENPSHTTL